MEMQILDRSLKSIRSSIPSFVRKVFEVYNETQKDLASVVANNKKIFSTTKMFRDHNDHITYFDIMNEISKDISVKTQLTLTNCVSRFGSYYSEEYKLRGNYTGEASTQFPINSVQGIVSENRPHDIPFIKVSAIPSNISSNRTYNHDYKIDFFDKEGSATIFEFMQSVLYIDVDHMFDYFYRTFHKIVKSSTVYESENTIVDYDLNINKDVFIRIADYLNNIENIETITEIVNTYTKSIIRSASLTYLIFIGKTLHAKTSTVDWFYSTFMKEFVNNLDGIRPPRTIAPSDTMNDKTEPIQFAYSNWTFVLDSLLKTNNEDKKNTYIHFGRDVLLHLISSKFTATNAMYQFTKDGMKEVTDLISVANRFVFDSDNKMYLKECSNIQKNLRYNRIHDYTDSVSLYGYHRPELFDTAVQKKHLDTTKLFAKLFIQSSYLIVLYKTISRISQSINEKTFYNGKTLHELSVEKFSQVLLGISKTINSNRSSLLSNHFKNIPINSQHKERLLKEYLQILSSNSQNYDGFVYDYKPLLEFYSTRNNKIEQSYNKDEGIENLIIFDSLYYIEPITPLNWIRNAFETYNLQEELSNQLSHYGDDASTSIIGGKALFGEILSDSTAEFMNRPNPAILQSLETLEQAFEDLKSEVSGESEWAYGNYNALAGLNTGVISITNDLYTSSVNKGDISTDVDKMILTQGGDMAKDEDEDETVTTTAEESYETRVHRLSYNLNKLMVEKFT